MVGHGLSNTNIPIDIVPDGGWGWIVVFSSFMIHFIMDGITYAMADIYLEPMLKATNESRATVSAIFSNLPAVTLCTGPVATVLTNMYGCRIVTIVGACLAALGFFLSRWWDNIVYYYITIGAMGGVGFGLFYAPALISVQYYFERRKSKAIGIAVSASGLGTLMFPPVMHWMIGVVFQHDYKPALLVKAGIILTCVIFGALMKPLPQERSEKRRENIRKRKQEKRQLSIAQPGSTIEEHQQRKPLLTDNAATITSEARPDPELLPTQPDVARKDAVDPSSPETGSTTPTGADVKVKSFWSELKAEIGIKFLADGAFLLFTISNFMTSLGFNVPYNFAHDLAKDARVVEHHREYVIMSIGLSNTFGRLIIGYLGDWERINRLYMYNVTLVLAGIATILAPYCDSRVISHVAYASIFGCFSGGYVGLTFVIIGDLVGTENASSALGIILLVQGIAVFMGTPITGYMRDKFSKHARPFLWPYFLFGSFIVLSGIILFGIPALKRRKQYLRTATKTREDSGAAPSDHDNIASNREQQPSPPSV